MIATIKGEYYNTEKAQMIATTAILTETNPSTQITTVYKAIKHANKDTHFFLYYATGNPPTEKVVPLTKDEAKRVTQRMLSEEEWTRVWSDIEAGAVPCNITTKKSVNDEFRRLRKEAGMKSGEFLERLIEVYKENVNPPT